MKKIFLCTIVTMAVLSCTAPDHHDQYLSDRVMVLEARIDSLERLLRPDQPVTPHRKTVSKRKTATGRSSTAVAASPATGYCHGITKKGYQCSRRVRSGLYCWQHG